MQAISYILEVMMLREMAVTSSAFMDGGRIPAKYTCDGDNVNPPLNVKGIPEGTKSLVLIVDDPDCPTGTWDHWIVWNILPEGKIEEDSVPGTEGMNDFREHSYGGPCPPPGIHRYFFKVYALDKKLGWGLEQSSRKVDAERSMKGHIIAEGQLVGLYSRR